MTRIITFISDFGDQDWFVAAVKGEILKLCKNVLLIDISHKIAPHDIRAAAFLLKSVYKNFPVGTINLAVVDPGVGSERKPVLVESEGYYFVGPDNGIFSYIYTAKSRVYKLRTKKPVSSTFHARDIFGPSAARLANGVKPNELGNRLKEYVRFEFPRLRKENRKIHGEVVYIDHFGNLITNIPNNLKLKEFMIKNRTIAVKNSYSEAGRREIVSVHGSIGYYEIAANMASAQRILGAGIGTRVWSRTKAPNRKC